MIRQEKERIDQKRLKEALASGELILVVVEEEEKEEEEKEEEKKEETEKDAEKEKEITKVGDDDKEDGSARLLMSPEWRLVILIGGLFGLAPNLCYCYVLALSFFSTPTETGALKPEINAAVIRGFRLASIAKLGRELLVSFG